MTPTWRCPICRQRKRTRRQRTCSKACAQARLALLRALDPFAHERPPRDARWQQEGR